MKNVRDLFKLSVTCYAAGDPHGSRKCGNDRKYRVLVDICEHGKRDILYTVEVYKIVPASGYYEHPYVATRASLQSQGVPAHMLRAADSCKGVIR